MKKRVKNPLGVGKKKSLNSFKRYVRTMSLSRLKIEKAKAEKALNNESSNIAVLISYLALITSGYKSIAGVIQNFVDTNSFLCSVLFFILTVLIYYIPVKLLINITRYLSQQRYADDKIIILNLVIKRREKELKGIKNKQTTNNYKKIKDKKINIKRLNQEDISKGRKKNKENI